MKDYVGEDREWNWPVLMHLLPQYVCWQIAGILPPYWNSGVNHVFWKASSSGDCTTRSTYEILAKAEWG